MSKIDDAFSFYSKHIYDEEKISLLTQYNLKIAGSVSSVLWELFGAILTGRSGAGISGVDLVGWEVKSATSSGSYEYQYHLNTGVGKLKEDCLVNHLFCKYSKTYSDVSVKAINGDELAEQFFKSWMPEYADNYNTSVPISQRRQRFRKSIPSGYVEKNGAVILQIKNGIILERHDEILDKFNDR